MRRKGDGLDSKNKHAMGHWRFVSWLAMLWVLILAVGTVGQVQPWFESPELGLPLWAGLIFLALNQVFLPVNTRASYFMGVAAVSAAFLLFAHNCTILDSGKLLANESVGGAASIGLLVLSGWLLAVTVAGMCHVLIHPVAVAVSLLAAALATIAMTAVCVFFLGCWLLFGEWPDSRTLIGPATMLAMVLLTTSVVSSSWAMVRKIEVTSPNDAYRWAFARKLSLLLTATYIAGLAVAVMNGSAIADLMVDGLLSRIQRRASTIVQFVERHAEAEREAADQVGIDGKRSARAARSHIDGSLPNDAWRAKGLNLSWPVSAHHGVQADILADASVRLAFERGTPTSRDRFVHEPELRDFLSRSSGQDDLGGDVRTWLCKPSGPEGLSCAKLMPGTGDRPEVKAVTVRPSRFHRLVALQGLSVGASLGATSPLGDLGSVLLMEVEAADVSRFLGRELLGATGVLSILALIFAGWSYRRQLPQIKALYQARAQADALLHQMPMSVLVLDAQHKILQVNAAAENLLGWPEHDLLGRQATEYFGNESLANLRRLEKSSPFASTVLSADKSHIPVEMHWMQYQVMGAGVTLVLLRDVRTELRDANEILRWRTVFDEAGWGIVLGSAGPEPVLELVNAAYARMLGYEPDELLGVRVKEMVSPELWDEWLAMRGAVQRGGPVQGHLKHRRRDGGVIPTLVSMTALRDLAGNITHHLVSVQDVSALRLAEDAATRQAAHLQAVLEALPVGVWIGDQMGRVQQTNQSAASFWGDALSLQMPVHESLMRRAATTGIQVGASLVDRVAMDGTQRSLLTTATPIFDGVTNQVVGSLAIDEDVSAIKSGQVALSDANALLDRVLQACAVGIALLDDSEHLLSHNPAMQILLGEPPRTSFLGALLEPEDSLRQRALVARVSTGELPTYVGEHRVRRGDGRFGWCLLVVSRLQAGRDMAARVLIQMMDIDARRRASEEVTASNLRLAVAQKLARVGDWQWQVVQGQFICSEQMLALLGVDVRNGNAISRDELLRVVHTDDRVRLNRALDHAVLRVARLSEDVRLLSEDVIVHLQGVAQRTSSGVLVTGTLQDISDRKAIEEELRASRERLRELIAYEDQMLDDERKRIAREVHDELGQLVTALRMDLSMLRTEVPETMQGTKRFERMKETVATMAEVVRHVASNLRPAVLDLGLGAAIEWIAEDFALRWEMRVELSVPKEHEPVLDEGVSQAIFRAVQESLTNIAKHAHASHVVISMAQHAGDLVVRVEDDGRGFDTVAVSETRRGGLGILGMRERMIAIGATLQINSGADGTTVEICYALNQSTRQSHDEVI